MENALQRDQGAQTIEDGQLSLSTSQPTCVRILDKRLTPTLHNKSNPGDTVNRTLAFQVVNQYNNERSASV